MKKPARSRKSPAQRSARLGAYLAAGLGASTIGTAQSAIVVFDVDPAKTIGVAGTPTPNQTVSFTDINIGAGTYSSSIGYGPPTVSGPSLWFTITGANQFTAEGAGGLALSSVFTGFSSPDNLRSFSAGQEIGTGTKYTVGPIAGWNGSGTGYVGLRFDTPGASNFGWLELDYVANGASTTLTVGGFAFEDQPGVAIAAGAEVSPIPEPGTWAAAALLAGGAAFLRWRKRRDEAQKEAA